MAERWPEIGREMAVSSSRGPGGRGAVREVVERLLKARGAWEASVKFYAEQT